MSNRNGMSSFLSVNRIGSLTPFKTSGYPTLATREFLHLLSETLPAIVHFLYYTDYDIHGCHIFTILKYGCKATAWASDMMVCPRLVWAGPKRQDFFDFHRKNHNDPNTWEARKAEVERKFVKTLNRVDKSLITCMRNLDLLRNEHVLRQEIEAMEAGLGVSLHGVIPKGY